MGSAVSRLLHESAMPPDTCPLCGVSVSLLIAKESRREPDVLRARIATLRQRVTDLEEGEVTPRQLADDILWMCAGCQRVMAELPALDRTEIQRRINEHRHQLERRLAIVEQRAS